MENLQMVYLVMVRVMMVALVLGSVSSVARGQNDKLLMDTPEHAIQSLWTIQIQRDTVQYLFLEGSEVLLTQQAVDGLGENRKAQMEKIKYELLRGRNRFTSVRATGPHAIVETEEYVQPDQSAVAIRYELVKEFGEWKISSATFDCGRCTRGIDKQGYPCDKCNGTGWLDALPLLMKR